MKLLGTDLVRRSEVLAVLRDWATTYGEQNNAMHDYMEAVGLVWAIPSDRYMTLSEEIVARNYRNGYRLYCIYANLVDSQENNTRYYAWGINKNEAVKRFKDLLAYMKVMAVCEETMSGASDICKDPMKHIII